MVYIEDGQQPAEHDCPFCVAPTLPDEKALIVARGTFCYVLLNLYPYNSGHLLVCPYRHIALYDQANEDEVAEMGSLTQTAMRVLRTVAHCDGFNLGMNQGQIAGAGIAEHLHQHIVPRWALDLNFFPIIARTKALPRLLGDVRPPPPTPGRNRACARGRAPTCPIAARLGSWRNPNTYDDWMSSHERATVPETNNWYGTSRVKRGPAEMLKGGVIMDVVTADEAKIAEDAGAVAVMALERVPADIRAQGGDARMSDPDLIDGIIEAVSIPVMAKARIGHFVEAQVLAGAQGRLHRRIRGAEPRRLRATTSTSGSSPCRSSAARRTSARRCGASPRARR